MNVLIELSDRDFDSVVVIDSVLSSWLETSCFDGLLCGTSRAKGVLAAAPFSPCSYSRLVTAATKSSLTLDGGQSKIRGSGVDTRDLEGEINLIYAFHFACS